MKINCVNYANNIKTMCHRLALLGSCRLILKINEAQTQRLPHLHRSYCSSNGSGSDINDKNSDREEDLKSRLLEAFLRVDPPLIADRTPDPSDEALEALQRRIGYHFHHPQLLKMALTHRSVGGAALTTLAWLGDSALSFILTEQLAAYSLSAENTTHTLHQVRARLASREACAIRAQALGMPSLLIIGRGLQVQNEMSQIPLNQKSVLGEAFEALLGAVMVDGGGIGAVRSVYTKNFPIQDEIKTLHA